MKNLASLNKYFVKYKWRLLMGLAFVTISNLFTVLAPAVVGSILDEVLQNVNNYQLLSNTGLAGDMQSYIISMVFWNSMLLLGLALMRGIFMFFMRQTIIVMSRLIEFDQKNEIYKHYQDLHTQFYKTHFTGDLMNRMSEDVSRVRMYIGPAIMYATNLVALIAMCLWEMWRVSPTLTVYVMLPLPFLALSIFLINKIIFRKSEHIQAQLSDLTVTAQETYSGIRVIKSFVQEANMLRFFNNTSEKYRKSAVNLSLTEAIYFPAMNLFIGLSILITVFEGGLLAFKGQVTPGNVAQFVMYITLMMFPISSIGWVASITQRASASQKRINEFLHTKTEIEGPAHAQDHTLTGAVHFDHVSFTYAHTGIKALKDLDLHIQAGQKIAVIGKTGSGKSTIAHLLLRMYDPQTGKVMLDDRNVTSFSLRNLRRQIAYAPQDTYLFSDTIYNNIKFGRDEATEPEVMEAARLADLDKDVASLQNGYQTVVGERGVMLSGGQKQRIVLARALLKNSKLLILDECLSAVDTQTEKTILGNLSGYLEDKTTIVITHRLFTSWTFDKIIIMEDGHIVESGTHEELMERNGRYAKLYRHQTAVSY